MIISEQKILDIAKLRNDDGKSRLFDKIMHFVRPRIESDEERALKKVSKIEGLIEYKRQRLQEERRLLEEYNVKILKKKEIIKRLKKLGNIISSNILQENQKYETSVLIRSIENVSLDRIDKMISNFLS